MKIKNIFTVTLVVIMVLCVFAGCNSKDETPQPQQQSEANDTNTLQEQNEEQPTEDLEAILAEMLKAYHTGDAYAYYEYNTDPYELKHQIESDEYTSESKEDIVEYFEDFVSANYSDNKAVCGENITCEVSVTNSWIYTKEEVDIIEKHLETNFPHYENAVIDGYAVLEAEVTIKGDKDSKTTTLEYPMARIDGNWYIYGAEDMSNRNNIEYVLENE